MQMPFPYWRFSPVAIENSKGPKTHPLETKDGAPSVSLYFREFYCSGILSAAEMSTNSILSPGHPPCV
jgi:hypothetical protein